LTQPLQEAISNGSVAIDEPAGPGYNPNDPGSRRCQVVKMKANLIMLLAALLLKTAHHE